MRKETWLIWKQPKTRRRYKIGILTYDDNQYKFKYINPELNDAVMEGFKYFLVFLILIQDYLILIDLIIWKS